MSDNDFKRAEQFFKNRSPTPIGKRKGKGKGKGKDRSPSQDRTYYLDKDGKKVAKHCRVFLATGKCEVQQKTGKACPYPHLNQAEFNTAQAKIA